ncbi:MAG: glycoside hydrolase family 2, partial [Deinococcus sp.]|nr:glycoside hydrolase family 2 [Deinococcus sp.]
HGYCYTQLTDTYQELNGLTEMNRTPKVEVARLSEAVRGESRNAANPLWYSKRWLNRVSPEGPATGRPVTETQP